MEETEFALTERFFPNFRRLYLRWMIPVEERSKKSFRWIYPLVILFVALRIWLVWTR